MTAVMTYPLALQRLRQAETNLEALQGQYDIVFAIGKWLVDRVPELAAAAQSAALVEQGFTRHKERHEVTVVGSRGRGWTPLCSCGWVGSCDRSNAYAETQHQTHVQGSGEMRS